MTIQSPDTSIPAPPQAEAPALRVARAAVDVGAVTTYYRRAGSGAPVLLLSSGGAGAALFESLSSRFRVFAPEPVVESGAEARAPAGGTAAPSFSRWLGDFLDGLGVMRASVVAEERFGIPALSFAISDPERVEGLVLLFRDARDPGLGGDALLDGLWQSGQPLLVLKMGSEAELADTAAAAELTERVVSFLSEVAG